jgi:glycosyltransferase involved in cell wall biosynthesis
MKLVVFAHKPPPNHGQSYMVQLLLDHLGTHTDRTHNPITIYHVDARFSDETGQIGRFNPAKVLRLFTYAAQAIYHRLRHGAKTLYYIPAPAKRVAIYRDWLAMLLCRPFFKTVIFHFHASGLGNWLETQAQPWERTLTRILLGKPSLSLVLGSANIPDAKALLSKEIKIVPNGLPDPCPHYSQSLQPERNRRRQRRIETLNTPSQDTQELYKILFIGLCTREKGLFDTLEAVAQLQNQLLQSNSPIRLQLLVAGPFAKASEELEFKELAHRINTSTNPTSAAPQTVQHLGFVSGDAKSKLFQDCDCLCFPTFYAAESFPLVVLEAMAHGLEIVASSWKNIPDILNPNYPGLVPPHSPQHLLEALQASLTSNLGNQNRQRFTQHLTLPAHIQQLSQAILSTTPSPKTQSP